jgi:putative copper resistance protein D
MSHPFYLLSVTIHVLAAMVWIGGAAFIALVLVPTLLREDFRERSPELLRAAALRFRTVGWISLGLLVITGFTNLHFRGIPLSVLLDGSIFQGAYGHALAVKLGTVAVILIISAVHDFTLGPRAAAVILRAPGSPEAAKARRVASFMGRITLLLGLVAVAAAIVLVRGW